MDANPSGKGHKAEISSRRAFLALGAGVGAAAGASGLATPALAQGFKRLKLASAWSRDLPVFFDIAQRFADRLTMVSGGQIRVEHFASNELISPNDLLDATGEGAVDAYHAFDYFWSSRDPQADLYSGVPFGMTIDEHLGWLVSGGQSHWDQWGSQFNIKPMMVGALGPHSGIWLSDAAMDKIGDGQMRTVNGLKIRGAGISGKLLAKMGAQVVQIPLPTLGQALSDGEVEAASGFVPLLDNLLGVDAGAGGLVGPGFWSPMQSMTLGLNSDFWSRLTPSEQMMVQMTASSVTQETLRRLVARDAQVQTTWLDQSVIKRTQFSREFLLEVGSQAGLLIEEIASHSRTASAAVDAFLRSRRENYVAANTGSVAFHQARLLPFSYARTAAVRDEIAAQEAIDRANAETRDQARREAEAALKAEAERQAGSARRAQAAREAEAARQQEIARQLEASRQAEIARQSQLVRQATATAGQVTVVPQLPSIDPTIAGGLDSPY